MPQIPRQFANGTQATLGFPGIPAAPKGQGLIALANGIGQLGNALATISTQFDEAGTLEAVQRYKIEAQTFQKKLQSADDFKNIGKDATDALSAIQEQYTTFVEKEYGKNALADFLRRTETFNLTLNGAIVNRAIELGQDSIVAKAETNIELAIENQDGDALQRALHSLETSAFVDQKKVASVRLNAAARLAIQPFRESALTDPMNVLNAIALDNIPKHVPQDMIDALAAKAQGQLKFNHGENDREERLDLRKRTEMNKAYKLAIHKKFAQILQLPNEKAMEALEAMESTVAEEAAITSEVETGLLLSYVEDDVVATMRTDRDAMRQRLESGGTVASTNRFNSYLVQITDWLDPKEADAILTKIRKDPELGSEPRAKLMERAIQNINNQLARDIKLGRGRINNRLRATGFGAQLVPETQLIASEAENEFVQSAYAHEQQLRSGEMTFEDISAPIIKKYQALERQSFYQGAQTIRPYVEKMIGEFKVKNKAGYTFATPQDMIQHAMQRAGADIPALTAARNFMNTMEAVNPEAWEKALKDFAKPTESEPVDGAAVPAIPPPTNKEQRENIKKLFDESMNHTADNMFAFN